MVLIRTLPTYVFRFVTLFLLAVVQLFISCLLNYMRPIVAHKRVTVKRDRLRVRFRYVRDTALRLKKTNLMT